MNPNDPIGKIMTVAGPISPQEMGLCLPHEHVMSTFGDAPARYPTYDLPRLLSIVIPYLDKLKTLGCRTLLDCTAAYFGRHPELLRQISQDSGMQIITNTGYYSAAQDYYVPEHAHHETAPQIAARWTREFFDGIDETGIRPGFIKTAVDDGDFSELDKKLVRAAILTHRQTGLAIQTHTGNNLEAAQGILRLFYEEGISASAWVWVHAHNVRETEQLIDAARKGAWISLDGLSEGTASFILLTLQKLKAARLLDKAMLSHDGDSYCAGAFRPYEYIFTDFLPLLERSGFSPQEVRLLTVENPARAFTLSRPTM
jgi:phosphotriesterase-related protein